jgi:hypothetical protein
LRQIRRSSADLPHLPQGLPKKIEFDLLLADLALKLGNTLLRDRKCASFRLAPRGITASGWTPSTPPKASSTVLAIDVLPSMQKCSANWTAPLR